MRAYLACKSRVNREVVKCATPWKYLHNVGHGRVDGLYKLIALSSTAESIHLKKFWLMKISYTLLNPPKNKEKVFYDIISLRDSVYKVISRFLFLNFFHKIQKIKK